MKYVTNTKIKIALSVDKVRLLRIPDTYGAKIAKIGNFWTF